MNFNDIKNPIVYHRYRIFFRLIFKKSAKNMSRKLFDDNCGINANHAK